MTKMNSLLTILILLTFFGCSSAEVISEGEGQDLQRDEKVLPFLAVVSFSPDECFVGTGAQMQRGTCYPKKLCTSRGGVQLTGTCAQGYGVCCSFTQMCPAGGGTVTIRNNLTTISNNAVEPSCNFVIPRQTDVCQIRIDFIQFQVGTRAYGTPVDVPPPGNPNALVNSGSCLQDRLFISPTQNLPDGISLCGNWMAPAQQHIYLHYGELDRISLSLTLQTAGQFSARVTMIRCNSPSRAPQGCTQYYQERAGRVQSFNYPNMQLNSHHYSVCIRSNGERQVQWRACPAPNPMVATSTSFLITGFAPPFQGLTGTQGCVTDYILIPGSDHERYCGGNFTTAQSRVIPFSLWVNFDESETPRELTPSSRTDPLTGCPLGFTCVPAVVAAGPALTRCDETGDDNLLGTCFPPPGYGDLRDNFNIGFCLDYTVGSP